MKWFRFRSYPGMTFKYVLDEVAGRFLAAVFLPLRPLVNLLPNQRNGEVWLIGENRGECLHDNGEAFFRYCQNVHPEIVTCFLVKSNSPRYNSLRQSGQNVVRYGSLQHMFLFMRATRGFYTHTYRDLMYRRFFEIFGTSIDLIYLHHGALGFKKFNAFYQAKSNVMRLFTVGSEFERDILISQVKVDPKRVLVTGYARYDRLEDRALVSPRSMVYMPTHRNYLLEAGKGMQFIDMVSGFIQNAALHDILERENIALKVYLHKEMQPFTHLLKSTCDRVEVLPFGKTSVQELIMESSVLITDYSSVSWDFFYLNKPVLFYRADIDDYLADRSSYIDLREEMIGPIAYDVQGLLAMIEAVCKRNFALEDRFQPVRTGVMPRLDSDNCNRIFNAVMNADEPRKL